MKDGETGDRASDLAADSAVAFPLWHWIKVTHVSLTFTNSKAESGRSKAEGRLTGSDLGAMGFPVEVL